MDEFTLNVGYAGIYVRTLPTTGNDGDVVITKQGFVYKWENDTWVRVDTTLEFLFLNTKRQQLLRVRLCSKDVFSCEHKIDFLLDIITNKIYQRRKKEWVVIDELTPLPNPSPNPIHVIHFSSGIVIHGIDSGIGFNLNLLPVNSPKNINGQIGIIGIMGSTDIYPAPTSIPFGVVTEGIIAFGVHIHKNGLLFNLNTTIHGIEITGPANTIVPLSVAVFINRDKTTKDLVYEQTQLQVTFNLLTNVENKSITISNVNLTNAVPVNISDEIFLVAYLQPDTPSSVDIKFKLSASVTQS